MGWAPAEEAIVEVEGPWDRGGRGDSVLSDGFVRLGTRSGSMFDGLEYDGIK